MYPPLDAARLREALIAQGPYARVEVMERIDSTNAELSRRAASRRPAHLTALLAEHQSAGRGRMHPLEPTPRHWLAPPRSSVIASVLFRRSTREARHRALPATLLGLTFALAAVETLDLVLAPGPRSPGRQGGVGLKWPNDVMVAGRKVAGVLASLTREGDVVVGIGLNVHQSESELPEPQAGSLAVLGAPNVDRTWLTIAVLSAAASGYERWARGDPRLREEIAGRMITLGVPAAVRQADGTVLSGEAVGIGPDGALELILPDGTRHHVYAGELLEDDWRRAREARLAAPEL